MANIIPVRIEQVEEPTYVQAIASVYDKKTHEPLDGNLEVYAGFLSLKAEEADGTLQHYTYRSFVPTINFDPSNDFTIRPYHDDGTPSNPNPPARNFNVAVAVSLAGASPNDSDSLTSVDSAAVKLEPQQFLGVNGDQQVMILSFNIGIQNTVLLRVAYTISVSSVTRPPARHPDQHDFIPVAQGTAPA